MRRQQQLNITIITVRVETMNTVQNFKYDHAKIREIASYIILATI